MRNEKKNTFTEYGIRRSSKIRRVTHMRRSGPTLKEQFTQKQQQKDGSSNLMAGFWGPWEANLIWKCNYTLHKLKVKMNRSSNSFLAVVIFVFFLPDIPSAWWQIDNDFIFVCAVPLGLLQGLFRGSHILSACKQNAKTWHKLWGVECLFTDKNHVSVVSYSPTPGLCMKPQDFIGGDWNKSAPLKC